MSQPDAPHDRGPRPPLSMKAAATRVVERLQSLGFTALFAGGCVRDMLMEREPKDYDVATSAKPEEVLGLFRRTQKVGAQFGVVLVRIGRHAIEVATFRRDQAYEDGRHPIGVEFCGPEEDARRRDFTINGMFFDPVGSEVMDLVGGKADLSAGLIRAIGEPEERFAEDHLRLLRAVRFAGRLGFQIESATWVAMQRHADQIAGISPERVRAELAAILSHERRAPAFTMLHESGLLPHLWPGATSHCADIDDITAILRALPIESSFEPALAVVMRTLPRADLIKTCQALRCSNFSTQRVAWLTAHQDDLVRPQDVTLADLKLLMANEAFDDLLALHTAKQTAASADMAPVELIKARVRDIPPEEVAPPPLLTGHDLAALPLPHGPRYKQILDAVYYAQLNGEVSDQPAAMDMAKRLCTVA